MDDTAHAATETQAPEVAIRRVTRADLERVVRLDERLTGIAKTGYWDDIFERYATRRLDERFFLIAEYAAGAEDAKIVGYIVGEVRAWEFGSEPCGWIFAFAVEPDMRLSGIGKRLFAEITEMVRGAGISTMRTMVSRENRLLMAFFRSEGMQAGPYIQMEMDLEE